MSQPKEKIPIEKLRELAKVLAFLHETTEKAVADFTAADFDSTDVEGWRTLHRGLVYAHRIVKKIAGPASAVQKLDLDVLLLPHHKSKKAKRSAEKKADLEKMDEAEVSPAFGDLLIRSHTTVRFTGAKGYYDHDPTISEIWINKDVLDFYRMMSAKP